jgi:hypothetical protein
MWWLQKETKKQLKERIIKERPMSTFVTTKTEGIYNQPLTHVLTIIFVALLIYSNTFNVPFQFDDIDNIIDNPSIKDLLHFPDAGMAKSGSISEDVKPFINTTRYIGYLTFALNYKLYGLDVRGYHLVNILIHMSNSLLLYWLMVFTFRTPFFSSEVGHQTLADASRNFIAVFTALLFAIHPIQTQAVTYIVQRFTSLATLFYLLSLVMYIKWKESKEQQTKRYVPSSMIFAISLLSAVLAMKTKEFAFTLPLVMAMYELMFFQGKIKRRLLYLVPFVLTMLIIPLTLTGAGGSLTDISGDEATALSETQDISRLDYLYTQFRVIVTYTRLLFLPINQNLDYDYPVYHSLLDPAVLFSFISLLLIFALGVYLYHMSRHPEIKGRYWLRLISFGIFWFFITLSVESSVIPIRDVIYEHRVYLPSAGFFIALTTVIGAGMERWVANHVWNIEDIISLIK